MILPHENTLVLTFGVNGFDVCIILIDLGSFADLLKMLAYRQMGYFSSTLKNLRHILIDFNRASTVFLDDVVLPVQAEPVTLNVYFSVVEDLSPYNAIIGWVWLHKMKVISSTYHQMVSYLTEVGQVDLLASQIGHPTMLPGDCRCWYTNLVGDKPESTSVNDQ